MKTRKLTPEAIRKALSDGALNRKQILEMIGASPTTNNYAIIERITEEEKIEIPQRSGNPTYTQLGKTEGEKQKYRNIIQSSTSIKDAAEKLGLSVTNNRRIKKLATELDVALPDYRSTERTTLEDVLKDKASRILTKTNRRIPGARIKEIVFGLNLLQKKCSWCGCEEEWNGKKLTLQIDHINGIATDNRINNLRVLCPNCHSQTDTFAGRSKRL